MRTTRVTPDLLRCEHACEDQVELFIEWLGERQSCEITRSNLLSADKAGLDIVWLIVRSNLLHGDYNRSILLSCGRPEWAYHYALRVDRCPQDDTRAVAMLDPKWAYHYDWDFN